MEHGEKTLAVATYERDQAFEHLLRIGQLANASASSHVLEEYQLKQTAQTLRRQRADLSLFMRYLYEAAHEVWEEGGKVGPEPKPETYVPMIDDLARWGGITHGLVKGFRSWMLQHSYAIGSVNVRMSTIKRYCSLAHEGGYLPLPEYVLIDAIHSISSKEGRNIDEQRGTHSSRIGEKKARPNRLRARACQQLKDGLRVSGDPLAPRDLLLVCLLADQGLRCGEVAALEVENLDLDGGMLTFYRHKVHTWQQHYLTHDTTRAAQLYLTHFHPTRFLFEGDPRDEKRAADGTLIRPGKTPQDGYDDTSITARLQVLGKRYLQLTNLSPHDLRHSWAKEMGEEKNIKALQQAGGWNSLRMPAHYMGEAEIANEGLIDPKTRRRRSLSQQ